MAADGVSSTAQAIRRKKTAYAWFERKVRLGTMVVSISFLGAAINGFGKLEQGQGEGRPKAWGSVMRRELPRPVGSESQGDGSVAVGTGRPGHWGSMMRREAGPVVATATSAENSTAGSADMAKSERPAHWGSMIRREEKQVAAIDTPAGDKADGGSVGSQDRPAHWGSMMRAEEKRVVAAGAPADSNAGGTSMAKKERPEYWGSMMRRQEPRTPLVGSSVEGKPADVNSIGSEGRPGHWGGMMRRESEAAPVASDHGATASFITLSKDMIGDLFSGAKNGRVFIFLIASIGFGLQVKEMLVSVLQASKKCEEGIGKKY